jgi:SOS-response transcriptional repressor LexA
MSSGHIYPYFARKEDIVEALVGQEESQLALLVQDNESPRLDLLNPDRIDPTAQLLDQGKRLSKKSAISLLRAVSHWRRAMKPTDTGVFWGSPPVLALQLGRPVVEASPNPMPLSGIRAQLGLPSPSDDFMDEAIDLHRLLVRNPSATFVYRADGWSIIEAGICGSDILVVDRSVTPLAGDLVIAV